MTMTAITIAMIVRVVVVPIAMTVTTIVMIVVPIVTIVIMMIVRVVVVPIAMTVSDRDDRRAGSVVGRGRGVGPQPALRQPTRTTTSTVPIAKSVPSVLAAASAATLILLRTDASKGSLAA
ncbi:MAG: hypothetical protein ACLT3W_02590 [Bifidobacterium pseudocatenulatum]